MKFSLEAVFHRKLKSLNVTKGQQGYIMGAFREACKELGVDYDCEWQEQIVYAGDKEIGRSWIKKPSQEVIIDICDNRLADYDNAIRQREALDKLKCVHGTPFQETCDYCAALELLRVKP